MEEEEKKKMKYPYRVSCQNSLRPTFSVYWFVGHNLWRKLHAAPWPLLFFFNKWTVLVSKKNYNLTAELQKRAYRANRLVLFFLAGANFWGKHAKKRAIMSMAHIAYTIAH